MFSITGLNWRHLSIYHTDDVSKTTIGSIKSLAETQQIFHKLCLQQLQQV